MRLGLTLVFDGGRWGFVVADLSMNVVFKFFVDFVSSGKF